MSTKKQEAKELFRDANKLYEGQLYEEALDHYQRATKLDATFYDAHFCVAKTKIRLKDSEKGAKHFQKHIHLIPEEDRAMYAVGLAGILMEEGQHEKAFELVQKRGNQISGEQLPTYLKILVANGEINSVLLHLLNLPRKKISALHQQLVNNHSIKETYRKKLQREYAIPEYHDATDKALLLADAPAESAEYSREVESLQSYIEQGKKDFGDSLQRYLDNLNEKIAEVQQLLAGRVQHNIDQHNTSRAQTQLTILEKTEYDPVKIQNLRTSLEAVKRQQRNTYLKYAAVGVLAILVLFGAFKGYGYLSHSWAWSETRDADTYKAYQDYIVEYPEGSNIEEAKKFAEKRLWDGIKKDSTQARFEEYLDQYPNGQFSDDARNILNEQFGVASQNVAASSTRRTSTQTNTTRTARVTGSDVIIRSDHTTESEVAGVVENEGDEVAILDEYYPQNADEAILSRSITVYENGESIELNEGKAVSILSSSSERARVSFAHEGHGRVTTTIDRDVLEGISGEKWYKISTSHGTTGWMYGQFIEEL